MQNSDIIFLDGGVGMELRKMYCKNDQYTNMKI